MKRCNDCGIVKPLAEFPTFKKARDGHRRVCIECAIVKKQTGVFIDCPVCLKSFEQPHANKKYCSTKCQSAVYRSTDKGRESKQEYNKQKKTDDPHYRRKYWLKERFGITNEIYEELLESQGGGCAICGLERERNGNHLAVDHDHKTGEIFGILCAACNKILVGHIRNPVLFTKAGEYLTKGTGLFVPEKHKKPKRRRRPRKTNG